MFKLKSTLAACVALAMIGGIIACTTRPAASGDSDKKTKPRQESTAAAGPTATESGPWRNPAGPGRHSGAGEVIARGGGKQPNILVIMGDDVGWFNIGAYHRGIMSGKTPNLDKLAAQGMMFTDYYAEASCTAGRANFITGEIPLRTGLTTVGQAGADVGLPAQACTLATALKSHGLRHRAVRQEPPRRPEQVPADGARLRRVLRLPVPPRRDVGPVLVRLSPGLDRQDRPAQSGALLGDGRG